MSEEQEDKLFELAKLSIDESSFLRFSEALSADRKSAESLPISRDGFQGEWANQSLQEFLGAATRWAKDSQFGIRPGPKPSNPWQLFALFLCAGRGYE